MSKRLIGKIAKLLSERYELDSDKPEEVERDAEDILNLILEEQDAEEKLVVVGQVLYTGAEKPVTVALGPFGGRAAKASQDAAGRLVYNPQNKTVKGQYMVVKMYKSPQKVYEAFGKDNTAEVDDLVPKMAEATWHLSDVPACSCGLRSASYCYRHERKL